MKRSLLTASAAIVTGLSVAGSAQSTVGRTSCRLRRSTCTGATTTRGSRNLFSESRPATACTSRRWWRAGVERLRMAGVKRRRDTRASMHAVEARVTRPRPGPHPLTGPIYVEGREPGDVLEVHLVTIEFLHPFGVAAFSSRQRSAAGRFSLRALNSFSAGRPAPPAYSFGLACDCGLFLLWINWRRASRVQRQALQHTSRLARRESRQQGPRGGIGAVPAGACRRRAALARRRTRDAGRRRSQRRGSRNVAPRHH